MAKINQEEYKVLKGLDDKWEWIARDKNRCLYVFTGKPVKKYGPLLYWGTEGFLSFELFDEKDLFHFIQWEDREPYNIAELIDEYLDDEYGYFNMKLLREFEEFIKKESEDTGMKKETEGLLCYALIKGHELIPEDNRRYWNLDTNNNDIFLSDRCTVHGWKLTQMSKSEWNRSGINDSNAEFRKVEEVAE